MLALLSGNIGQCNFITLFLLSAVACDSMKQVVMYAEIITDIHRFFSLDCIFLMYAEADDNGKMYADFVYADSTH